MSRTRSASDHRKVVAAALVACVALAAALAGLFAGGGFGLVDSGGASERQFAAARSAFDEGDFKRAELLCTEVLDAPSDGDTTLAALLLAGRAAAERGRFAAALDYWHRVETAAANSSAPASLDAVAEASYLAGRVLLYEQHQAAAAEQQFRRVLEVRPEAVPALHELARLLAVEGRRSEAVPQILTAIALGHVDVDQLALLGMRLGTIHDAELLRACYLADRLNPALLVGVAASSAFSVTPDEARILLEEAVRLRPDLIDAQVRLGWLLAESGDRPAFLAWHEALPAAADEHATVWLLRADVARQRGEVDVAKRCYWETLRRDPNDRAALYQLGQILLHSGETAAAAPLIDRGHELQELRELQDVLFYADHTSLAPVRAVAEQFERLGRPYEACGWCRMALQQAPETLWARDMADRLQPLLDRRPPQTLAAVSPVMELDFSNYPRPDWRPQFAADATAATLPDAGRGELRDDSPAVTQSAIRLVDEAAALGLDFTYEADSRPAAEGKRMYEFPGGGVAILDFDRDGRPDACLTQGCRWPPRPAQRESLDRLFRNRDGRRFDDVTLATRLVEPGYSHGATVGDFDNDGFPDLYVANIGRNRLFRNNGDGTFSDVSDAVADDAERWTTSCLLADLNGDGRPDLYNVNYVTAEDVFERICKHGDGQPRMCLPFHFPAAQDQVFVNLGDGRFADATNLSGIVADDGKGLGIVAADFDGTGRLSLLVANDTTPNFFFANRTGRAGRARGRDRQAAAGSSGMAGVREVVPVEPGAVERGMERPAKVGHRSAVAEVAPWFAEQGVATGLAFNGDGRAEGCMGIALGDIDQDGLFDLFVTNFLRETNTLYRQQSGAVFFDATSDFELDRPSVELLAFGTQFFDPDLDGDLDLIVTNGHVDDVRAYGRPYQMRPQLFENLGDGPLAERFAATVGEFFAGAYLGRGLARWDWNGDGREDVLISHLDAPAALLTSRSPTGNHFLAVRLCGTASGRDAIGAVLTARLGSRELVRHLSAGDGYQASNERRIVFGLGQADTVDQIEIRWPSGQVTVARDQPADTELLFIEGDSRSPLVARVKKRDETSPARDATRDPNAPLLEASAP